jgi:hypothetical protein
VPNVTLVLSSVFGLLSMARRGPATNSYRQQIGRQQGTDIVQEAPRNPGPVALEFH